MKGVYGLKGDLHVKVGVPWGGVVYKKKGGVVTPWCSYGIASAILEAPLHEASLEFWLLSHEAEAKSNLETHLGL